MPTEIALAASARAWPDTLHRFLLDHGGGVVSARIMSSEQALTDDYEVLLIDDISSFLTPRLVLRLRGSGRQVVGVFSPEDGTDAKRRLLECGISDVVETDATPEEFLEVIAGTLIHKSTPDRHSSPLSANAIRIGVMGGAPGVGCTEVSIALADGLSADHQVILVDLDQGYPGVAQRLGLPLHPNLHTAVDAAQHDPDRLKDATIPSAAFMVVGGVARSSPDRRIPNAEARALIEDLSVEAEFVVVDLGASADSVDVDVRIVVGEATPVGLRRLVEKIETLNLSEQDRPLAIVNRARPGTRKTDDIRRELSAALPDQTVMMIPEDKRVGEAGWNGALVSRGSFRRAMARVSSLLADGYRR